MKFKQAEGQEGKSTMWMAHLGVHYPSFFLSAVASFADQKKKPTKQKTNKKPSFIASTASKALGSSLTITSPGFPVLLSAHSWTPAEPGAKQRKKNIYMQALDQHG